MHVLTPSSLSSPHREVFVTGEVDIASVPELRRHLRQASTESRGRDLVVDLSAVTFMDCAGLRPLLEARFTQEASGGRLVLREAPSSVTRLLHLTGLLGLFAVVDATSPPCTTSVLVPARGL